MLPLSLNCILTVQITYCIESLKEIGEWQTENKELKELFPQMPEIKDVNNWQANNAYCKIEDGEFNIGLGGKGKALDIFNNNMILYS